jgi:putative ABC transport system permease protein
MIKNHLIVFIRNLSRQKTFSLINLTGLVLGVACFLFIALYVADELSYDRFHKKGDRVYRIITHATFDGQTRQWGFAPNKVATTANSEIPEVENAVRIFPHNFSGEAFISNGDIRFLEKGFAWADSTLFDIITFDFIRSTGTQLLNRPNTVVISESAARKYFNSSDVIGKTIKVDNEQELEVTAIFKDQPSNTLFQYSMIGSFHSIWAGNERNQSWSNASFGTFLLLNPGADSKQIDRKLQEMIDRNVPKENQYYTLSIVPLRDNHLYTASVEESGAVKKGDIRQVQLLIALGIVVLLIASINYVNMTTAQAQRRQKEIGINKTLGASKAVIARKFYFETATFVFLAMSAALFMVLLSLPVFNEVSGKALTNNFVTSPMFWLGFLTLGIVLSFLSGFYPSLYLSSLTAKQVLKSGRGTTVGNHTLRKGLVVAQFSISIVLIIATIVLFQQMKYIRDKKLGYEPEQVVAILTSGAETREQIIAFKNKLEQMTGVVTAARAQSYPGAGESGRTLAPISGPGEPIAISTVRATSEIVDVLGLRLLAGRTLPEKNLEDTTIQVVLNKTSIDFLGLSPEEAIGRQVDIFDDRLAEVVGVVDDFHFESLHTPIGAYCFHNGIRTEGLTYVLAKLRTDKLVPLLAEIQEEFKKVVPSAFEYIFLDAHLDSLYRVENRLVKIIFIFSILSIFIASLGLYALTSFTIEQRVKEIGIRKVLGASVMEISNMLSREFLILVAVAILVSIPISYYLMQEWLKGFHYKIEIHVVTYIFAAIVITTLAWITVGLKAVRAASVNPVDSLRSE